MSESNNYAGDVVGGPLDGDHVVGNASKGFVALNLNTSKVSVYDYDPSEAAFVHQYDADLDDSKLGKTQEDPQRFVVVIDAPQSGESEDIPEWEVEPEDGFNVAVSPEEKTSDG